MLELSAMACRSGVGAGGAGVELDSSHTEKK